METFALTLSALALAIALLALARSGKRSEVTGELDDRTRRRVDAAREEFASELQLQKKMLQRLASGAVLTPDMIAEGRLWSDVGAEVARERLTSAAWRSLDVRTPRETASGVIAGAILIPMDELEARVAELRADPRPLLVYCASGARSAAASEFLSGAGLGEVHNLDGGISAWTFGTVRPGQA